MDLYPISIGPPKFANGTLKKDTVYKDASSLSVTFAASATAMLTA